MTNIEKLIEKYGIENVMRIPENQGHLSHVITYGMQISMYELIEHLKISEYIASYRHLIGCEVYCSEKGGFFTFNENMNILSYDRFYLDDENLGTYQEYMQLHYPEYEHVWKHQL